jgi:hypothetical protein
MIIFVPYMKSGTTILFILIMSFFLNGILNNGMSDGQNNDVPWSMEISEHSFDTDCHDDDSVYEKHKSHKVEESLPSILSQIEFYNNVSQNSTWQPPEIII